MLVTSRAYMTADISSAPVHVWCVFVCWCAVAVQSHTHSPHTDTPTRTHAHGLGCWVCAVDDCIYVRLRSSRNGRCCAKPKKKWKRLPKRWMSMLPMSYIGATVPVLREAFLLPRRGSLSSCNIADAMARIAPDPDLYFHENMDQVTAMRHLDAFCQHNQNLTVVQDFDTHEPGQEACVQTRRPPVRLDRKISSKVSALYVCSGLRVTISAWRLLICVGCVSMSGARMCTCLDQRTHQTRGQLL